MHREIVAGDCAFAFAKVRVKLKPKMYVLYNAFAIAHQVGTDWEILALGYRPSSAF